MKRKLTFLTALLSGSLMVVGQNSQTQFPHIPAQSLHTAPAAATPSQLGDYDHNAAGRNTNGTIIWSEPFAGGLPNTWTKTDITGQGGWIWTTQTSQGQWAQGIGIINSPTANNGFMILDADGYNTPGTAQTYTDVESYITSPAIDLSQYPFVVLQFNHYFRPFADTEMLVEVSGDNGTTWTSYDVRNGQASNTASTNSVLETIYISQPAGGQSSVRIRFHWLGSSHYFWMLDDVRICPAPNNDIRLNQVFYNELLDSTSNRHYTNIPQNQTTGDTNRFAASYQNLGGSLQPNTKLGMTVTGPSTSFNNQSPPTNLNLNAFAGAELTSIDPYNYFIPWNLGNYNTSFLVTSDSVDVTIADNNIQEAFTVSTNTYARDLNDYNGQGFWYGAGTDYEIGLLYEIFNTDTLDELQYLFQGSTKVGTIIVPQVWDVNNLGAGGLLSTTNFITLNAADIDSWITIDVPNLALTPGDYIFGYQTISVDSCLIGASSSTIYNDETPPLTVFVNVNAGTWGYTTGFQPHIRMRTTGNVDPCNAPINQSVANITCLGQSDGSISLNIPGASTFNWSNGQSGANLTNLVAGNYTVTATGGGCTWNATFTVSQPTTLLNSNASGTPESCGGGNGTAVAGPSGGVTPYQYTWSNGQTGGTAINLNAGAYTVTVTDFGGCSSTSSVTITGTPGIGAAPTSTFVTCGQTDGSISLNVNSGTAPYTYSWSGPSGIGNTDNPTSLPIGVYSATVTDANGCTGDYSIDLTNQNPPQINPLFATSPLCNGDQNGFITIVLTGGTGTYTYNWAGPGPFSATTQNLTGLGPGTYQLTVADAQGCTGLYDTTLTDPPLLTSTSASTDATCNGDSDGSVSVTLAGGTSPYTIIWTGPLGGLGTTLNSRPAGNYTATISDANGCGITDQVVVNEPSAIQISNPIIIDNQPSGSISITVTGGAPPYGFQWSGPGNYFSGQEDITGLVDPGPYSVTITDADGCELVQSFDVLGVSVGELEAQIIAFEAYPNPVKGELFISFENLNKDNYTIELVSIIGKVAHSESLGMQGTQLKTIDVSNLAKGVYLLNVTSQEGTSTQRIIVQ